MLLENKQVDHWANQIQSPIGRLPNGDIDPEQFMLSDAEYLNYQQKLMSGYADTSFSQTELDYLRLPVRMPAIEVAERIRVPMKSNVFDRIDLSMTPYLIDPISLIGDESVRWIYVIAPTQSGKTVILQVAVADTIDQNPGTLLYIYPDENNGKASMQEKLIGMIKDTDFLYKHVVQPEKQNLSTKKIVLDNMTIWPAWSGSLGTLSSKPAKVIILDEIRLMKLSTGRESNAIKLASDRMTTFEAFGQAQAIGVTTPSVEGDLMWTQTQLPDIRILHRMLKCQSCDRFWAPKFKYHVKFDEGADKAILLCPYCHNQQIEGTHKRLLNKGSQYGIPAIHRGETSIPDIQTLKQAETLFWFESISSPFRSIARIAKEYENTMGSIENYRNTVQCWFAEFWKFSVSKTTAASLKKRIKSGYSRGTVPLGNKYLTAGVDAQDDGFYVTVLAWLKEKECYIVDAYKIECHKDTTTIAKTEAILERRLNTRRWDGWMVASWTIDIADGDRTHELLDATAEMDRCHRINGTNSSKQVTNIVYQSKLDYFLVKAYPYLDESDRLAATGKFHLYENIEQDFLTQFVNAQKVKELHPKTGLDIIVWKKSGQNDYRMAFVYGLECLDFPMEDGYTLRDMLEVDGYTNNPSISIYVDNTDRKSSSEGGNNDEHEEGYTSVEEDSLWTDM